MSAERFIQAPERRDISGPMIFLAGPIKGAGDWQSQAREFIYSIYPDVIIASPRRDELESDDFDYDQQTDWEFDHLDKAGGNGVVMFWLARELESIPGRSFAQTTRVEFGTWATENKYTGAKIVVGIEEGFSGANYIRKYLERRNPGVTILGTLEDTCLAAINAVKPKPQIHTEK